MKNLLLAFMAFTLVFTSCKKESDPKNEEENPKEEENPNPGGGNGGSTDMSVGIGKNFSGASNLDFNNKNAVVDFFAGEHPVAIYSTPAGKDNELGKGKLIISRDGNIFGMKLIAASGSTLAEAKVDLTNDKDYNYEGLRRAGNLYNLDVNQLVDMNPPYPRSQIGLYAAENGELTGGATYKEGALQYRFRNNVEHFGKTPPAAIAALKGTWEGAHIQPLCLPNTVTFSVADDGTITLKGKTALNCTSTEVTGKWDGQDDYVTANTTGWKSTNIGSMIHIEASQRGGSLPGGGIFILLPQLKNPTGILEVQNYAAGAAGNILVENPAKK